MQTPSDNPLNEPYNLVYLDSDEQIAKQNSAENMGGKKCDFVNKTETTNAIRMLSV